MTRRGPIEPVRKRLLADEIAERIRIRIFDGTFKPGEKLPPERELARELRVNRSSLREGLKMLQQLGLVAIRHGDGTRVLDFFQTASIEIVKYLLTDFTIDRPKIVLDIMEVRKIICEGVVRLASLRASREDIDEIRKQLAAARLQGPDNAEVIAQDFEFYEALAKVGGNVILTMMLNTVKPPFKFFKSVFSKLVFSKQEVWDTQDRILEAIERGDSEGAIAAAGNYLAKSAQYFFEQLGAAHGEVGVDGGQVYSSPSLEETPASTKRKVKGLKREAYFKEKLN